MIIGSQGQEGMQYNFKKYSPDSIMLRSETSIKTARLWLRQIDETDAEAIVSLRSNEDVYRYFLNPTKLCVDDHNLWYQDNYIQDPSRIDWMAVDDITGAFIGVYGAKKASDTSVEVSYITSPKHSHCGYASEAVSAIMDWCKDKWNVNIFMANVHQDNEKSILFAQRLGFQIVTYDGRFVVLKK